MDNVADLDLRRNTIRCDWNDEVFTIAKTIDGKTVSIPLSPDDEEYLVEQLAIKRQPWGSAG